MRPVAGWSNGSVRVDLTQSDLRLLVAALDGAIKVASGGDAILELREGLASLIGEPPETED